MSGRLSVGLACMLFLVAAPATSQGTNSAPSSRGARGSGLVFTLGAAEALDSELPAEVLSQVAGGLQSGGLSTMLNASADFTRNGRRLQVNGNASTAFRYQSDLDLLAAVGHYATLGASVRLPKEGSLRIAQDTAYTPSFLYRLFPSGPLPAADAPASPADFRIDQIASYTYTSNMALAVGSPRGTRLTTTADYTRTDFERQTAAWRDRTTFRAGTSLSRAVSRNVSLSADYDYRVAELLRGQTKQHGLGVGANYSRALSASRRATFRVNVNRTLLDIPEPAMAIDAANPGVTALAGRRYRTQGGAGIEYQFRLNWQATAAYDRRVDLLDVLTEPVYSDGVRVGLTGAFTRRVMLTAWASSATGASAISSGGRNLDTYTGTLRLSYAPARSITFYSEYSYYYYDLGGQARLAPELPSVFERHGVRVGFMQVLGRSLVERGRRGGQNADPR